MVAYWVMAAGLVGGGVIMTFRCGGWGMSGGVMRGFANIQWRVTRRRSSGSESCGCKYISGAFRRPPASVAVWNCGPCC